MSATADRRSRVRHSCDRHHVLCFECFVADRDGRHPRLADVSAAPLRSPFGSEGRKPSELSVDHRRRMLAHLQATQ
jgi:hypothetical protein